MRRNKGRAEKKKCKTIKQADKREKKQRMKEIIKRKTRMKK